MYYFELIATWLQPKSHDILKINVQSPLLFNLEIILFIIVGMFIRARDESNEIISHEFTDTAKGIAIFIIIINHLCRHTIADYQDLYLFSYLGTKGVAIFLMISGYGLSCSYHNSGLTDYFKKKLFRIYIPFLACNIMMALIAKLYTDQSIDMIEYAKQIAGYKTIDRNFWYVNYLFFWYTLFYICYKIEISKNIRIALLLGGSMLTIFCADMVPNARLNAVSFPIGVIIAEHRNVVYNYIHNSNIKKILLQLGLLIFAIFLYQFFNEWIDHHIYIYLTFIIILMILRFIFKLSLPELAASIIIVCLGWNFTYNVVASDFLFFSIKNSCIAMLILIAIKFLSIRKYSLVFSRIGELSLEIFLLHGFFMYSYDFILYRMRIEISFWIYFTTIIFLSAIAHRVTCKTATELSRIITK